ncbi:MAG: oligoribonuclease [Myxococcales bacterium]|nr:oligoribonuclease [Myxococcales bacterium]
MEMSGLDPERCRILELATIVTNGDLEVLAEGPDLVVHQPDEVLDAMDDWCTRHHGDSGLTAQVRASTLDEAEAERQTLEFLAGWTQPGASPLCGSAIFQDRRFLMRHMPRFYEFLHYRLIDVSSVKELARRWFPEVRPPSRPETHRAGDDVRASIEQLRFYRQHLFR